MLRFLRPTFSVSFLVSTSISSTSPSPSRLLQSLLLHPPSTFSITTPSRSYTMAPVPSTPKVDPTEFVDRAIKSNRVYIFSKTTCPYCVKVKALLDSMHQRYGVLELDVHPDGEAIKKAVVAKTGATSVPQVFINGERIGGCDDTYKAYEEGRLRNLLVEHEYDYDLVVIGGGSGGLACSKESASYGKKVALFDYVVPTPHGTSWGLGGTCVNVGCIPKKLMHQAAIVGEYIGMGERFGFLPADGSAKHIKDYIKFDWATLVERVTNTIKSSNFGYRVNLRQNKVNYINAYAEFVDQHTLKTTTKSGEVKNVTADKILIATGERPRYPDIEGAQFGVTSDDLFSLPYEPGKTLVVGASYVALECAGFLHGVGYHTEVLVRSILLRGFDQGMAEKIGQYMASIGVKFHRPSVPVKVEQLKAPEGGKPGLHRVTWKNPTSGEVTTGEFNTVLWAIGRDPCTNKIGAENIGLCLDPKTHKVIVNDKEETNIPNVYAVGDILKDRLELTPVAIKAGQALARRLFAGKSDLFDYNNVATTVFTPIEYGCVGLSEEAAYEKYGEENIEVYSQAFRPYEWGCTTRSVNICFAKLVCLKNDGEKVIGFHYFGPNASEVTQLATFPVKLRVKKIEFDQIVGIHPSSAETFTTLSITKSSGEDPNEVKTCCG